MYQQNENDDSWEEFFGSSPDLMPTIMGAFDSFLYAKKTLSSSSSSTTPKRHFANLSPGVQKILSHVSDLDSVIEDRGFVHRKSRTDRYRNSMLSNENLDIISPGVHKMLSNLQDSELVISTNNLNINNNNQFTTRNPSYLYSSAKRQSATTSDVNGNTSDNDDEDFRQKPLGSYLHSAKGIASRTPVGRKSLGKHSQIPSQTSTGVTNSTASSSEVSRPVSMTSLGSCSSSGSSNVGLQQQGSAYLPSAESLDSDPEPTSSQGSADSGIAEQDPPSITPEQRVLQEVLDTEAVYVRDLQEVIQGYLEPWRNDPQSPMREHLADLFANLEQVHEFNKTILDDLQESILDPIKTANVFLQHNDDFKVYNEYCARYPRTMEILSELQRDDSDNKLLIREKQRELGHMLPLGSYLLKPVQRILKYHLLLQRLSKQCAPQHKPTVDLALTTMTSVAADINNMKRKHEHAVRVHEIQSQLYGWHGEDLTTLGELIVEGMFRMQGAKGRRHVFLFEKILLLAKSKTEGALTYKTHIECSNLMLVEQVRGDPLSFQVLPFDNPRNQCTIRARSIHQKREWTLQIKRAILENFSAEIPNHARQLVMQLGQDQSTNDNNDETCERWSPLKNSTTPHYLERRSRRKTRDLKERSTSQERSFTSFGSWRRKSEPSSVPQQYDSSVVPKRISKLRKTKETSLGSSSTFYTDLSDSENCDESVESLATKEEEEEIGISEKAAVEKVMSELLGNASFQKVSNRTTVPQQQQQHQRHPRRNVTSEPGPIWYDERPQLPSKADSLPRSFQLNDPLNEPSAAVEGKEETAIISRLEESHNDHPEYKIYRRTPLRLSILNRIRTILSEEPRRKGPKGCKNTGEKLANPDYVDPQSLFRNNSESSLLPDSGVASFETTEEGWDALELDLSLNVLNEVDKRLNPSPDSYYESILDKSLTEEYERDSTGKLVAKSDSFTEKQPIIVKRAPPPPIPAKPLRLLNYKRNQQQTSWVRTMVGRFE